MSARSVRRHVRGPVAMFGAGLLVAGLGVGLLAGSSLRDRDAPTVIGPDAGSSGLPFGARMPDAAGAVRAAVGFVRVLARPRAGWHAAARVLVTSELAVALDATDPGALPDADPTDAPQVRSLAEDSASTASPTKVTAVTLTS